MSGKDEKDDGRPPAEVGDKYRSRREADMACVYVRSAVSRARGPVSAYLSPRSRCLWFKL